jgi:hypothetical protein
MGSVSAAFDQADSVHFAIFRAAAFDLTMMRNFRNDFRADGALLAGAASFTPQTETRVRLEVDLRQDTDTLVVLSALGRKGIPLFAGLAVVTARRGETSAAAVPLMPVLNAITVATVPTITALGETAQLSAAVLLATGDTVPGVSLRYQSSNAAVVTVDAGGLVTAQGEGQTLVRVSTDNDSLLPPAIVPITVSAAVTSVTVTPPSATVNVGDSLRFTATARDRRNNVLNRTISWASAAPAIASIDAVTGVLRGVAPGTTTISAAAGGVTSNPVTVTSAALPRFTLTVTGNGNGAGTVAGDSINCTIARGIPSGRCSAQYVVGTQVRLTASATQGSIFSAWSGNCSGTAPCTLVMSDNRQVNATFNLAQSAPTISGLRLTQVILNSPACTASGFPTQMDFAFDFSDPNGNVTGALATPVTVTFRFQPSGTTNSFPASGTITGTGFAGTFAFSTCSLYGPDTSVDETVTLKDDGGLESNALTITVPKPAGAARVVSSSSGLKAVPRLPSPQT